MTGIYIDFVWLNILFIMCLSLGINALVLIRYIVKKYPHIFYDIID